MSPSREMMLHWDAPAGLRMVLGQGLRPAPAGRRAMRIDPVTALRHE